MQIKALHKDFIMPTKGTIYAGAYDLYMPSGGSIEPNGIAKVGLGFAAEVPINHVALLLPRSSSGGNGLELRNTCGVIDSDYRGEWIAKIQTKDGAPYSWNAGDRLLQFLIVPVLQVNLVLTDELSGTTRGAGGFGSTGS